MSNSNEQQTTTPQPILCVSRGHLKYNVTLLSEKHGVATYTTANEARDVDDTNTFTRPIDDFRRVYAVVANRR